MLLGVSARVFPKRLTELVRDVLNVLRGTTQELGPILNGKGGGRRKPVEQECSSFSAS